MFRIIDRTALVTIILCMTIKTVFSQQLSQTPQPPMILEPADAEAFKEILETTIPPRYNRALIQRYTTILQRHQAKVAAEAKAKEDKKDN
jgi:hypothetical protein